MKKASLILVALLLLVGMTVSAEGKWTNWGEGIMYPFYKVGDLDATAGWGPGWVGSVSGAYTEWNLAYDSDDFGYYAVWAFDSGANDNGLTRWAAWYKFGMLKAILGAPRVSDYRPASFIEGNHTGRLIDGNYGGVLQAMPVDGLSLGVALYVADAAPSAGTIDWAQAFGFGASYAIPDVATLYASARLDAEWFNASVNVTALEGIGLMASVAYDWTSGAEGLFALASAKLAAGPVALAIDAGLKTNGGAAFDTMVFGANLNASYPINDKWSVGVMGGYDNGAGLVGGGEGTPGAGVSVFPYVKAAFGDNYVKLGFVYAGGFDAHDSVAAVESVIAIPIMFVYAF